MILRIGERVGIQSRSLPRHPHRRLRPKNVRQFRNLRHARRHALRPQNDLRIVHAYAPPHAAGRTQQKDSQYDQNQLSHALYYTIFRNWADYQRNSTASPQFSVRQIGGAAVPPRHLQNAFQLLTSRLLVAALRAASLSVQRDATERTPLERDARRVFLRRGVDAAREREPHDVELVLEELVRHLDESLDGHGLLRDHEPALGIRGAEVRLERGTLHRVRGRAVPDALLLVDVENRREKRIVLAQDERVVEVPEDVPGGLLDLVAREDHVDARIDRVLDLQRQPAGVSVQVLRLALEPVEPVGVLDVEMRDRPDRLAAALGVLVHRLVPFYFHVFRSR